VVALHAPPFRRGRTGLHPSRRRPDRTGDVGSLRRFPDPGASVDDPGGVSGVIPSSRSSSMTNLNDSLRGLEHEVVRTRAASEPPLEPSLALPLESRTAYARALRFLGCESVEVTLAESIMVPEPDRVRASKLMLLSLSLDTSSPAWSSWM